MKHIIWTIWYRPRSFRKIRIVTNPILVFPLIIVVESPSISLFKCSMIGWNQFKLHGATIWHTTVTLNVPVKQKWTVLQAIRSYQLFLSPNFTFRPSSLMLYRPFLLFRTSTLLYPMLVGQFTFIFGRAKVGLLEIDLLICLFCRLFQFFRPFPPCTIKFGFSICSTSL